MVELNVQTETLMQGGDGTDRQREREMGGFSNLITPPDWKGAFNMYYKSQLCLVCGLHNAEAYAEAPR